MGGVVFSSSHEVLLQRSRRPLDGVNVPLHAVLQRRCGSALQLHLMYEASMTVLFGIISGFLLLLLTLVSLHIIFPFHFSFTGKIHHFPSLLLQLFSGETLAVIGVLWPLIAVSVSRWAGGFGFSFPLRLSRGVIVPVCFVRQRGSTSVS